MLDSSFVMLYTEGLYCCAPEHAPTYNEFRDMFSRGQLQSKFWLIEELNKVHKILNEKIIIVGSWFGTLGYLLQFQFKNSSVTCLDIDPRCEQFLNKLEPKGLPHKVIGITGDMYHYAYNHDVVINTSCEHITDLSTWLKDIPSGTIVILQSSNYNTLKEHTNCVFSIDEFKNQISTNISTIMFAGELKFSMYTRYMIIGKKT